MVVKDLKDNQSSYIKIYYERSANSNPYYSRNTELNSISKLLKELTAMDSIKDKLYIKSFRGGNRNPIVNECEIELEINVSEEEKYEDILNIIKELVDKYKANYIIGRGEKYDS